MANLRTRLGEIVKEHRGRMGLSQGDLAKRLGMTTPTIVSIEKARRPTDVDTLERVCKFFGLSAEALAAGEPVHSELSDHPLSPRCVQNVSEAALGKVQQDEQNVPGGMLDFLDTLDKQLESPDVRAAVKALMENKERQAAKKESR